MKRRSSTLSLIKKNKETKKNCRILSNVHASLHPGIESTDAHHKLSPIQIESAMFNALDASTLPLNNPSLPSSSRRRNRTSTDVDQPDRGSSSSTCGGGSSIHREIVFRVSSGKCSRAICGTKAVIPLCELAPLLPSSFSNPVICSSDSFPMSTQFPLRIGTAKCLATLLE